MKQTELQKILTGFAADRLALLERHEAGARVVSHYDFNNAYQYVINREEAQLAWLQSALAELGVVLPPPSRGAAPEGVARGRCSFAFTPGTFLFSPLTTIGPLHSHGPRSTSRGVFEKNVRLPSKL